MDGYAKVSFTKFALGNFEAPIRAAGYAARLATVAPGVPHLRRLATDGWSNPSEQRARTGLNQFVSDAQSVWLGGRTECPHRRRAPEGRQHL